MLHGEEMGGKEKLRHLQQVNKFTWRIKQIHPQRRGRGYLHMERHKQQSGIYDGTSRQIEKHQASVCNYTAYSVASVPGGAC